LRSTNWVLIFVIAAVLGALAGYVATLIYRPTLLPPALRIGSLREPTTILLLGVDVEYKDLGNRKKSIDQDAFSGRSDTIMVARFDPYRNAFGAVSIPRDTQVNIPGHRGTQKINGANAIGGAPLAQQTVSEFMQLPIDHYVVLNVHGLVELVNELGGVTVDIPKKMQYMDWTAKLKIDLEPGVHTLTGNQAMGFVRYRHDALGDIGRVQRQQIFLHAVLDKAKQPASWAHLPQLMEIAQKYISTDMSVPDMMAVAGFARAVPKQNQFLALMPGTFGDSGDWIVSRSDIRKMVARLEGSTFVNADRHDVRVSVENASSTPGLASQIAKMLRAKGYEANARSSADGHLEPNKHTRIIAQKANTEDAELVKLDLGNTGEVVNASVGDIESTVTVIAGEDMAPLMSASYK
jgi:polyisoprenyl-teichoic acid--peptidoglycan teichoic acid transferase